MFQKWTAKDSKWLFGILIGIIILLIASIFAKDKNIELNFSIISSAVSIALALVAIVFAWKQDSENQFVTRETSNLLTIITSKIENMDSKIDKLDPNSVTAPAETQLLNDINAIIKGNKREEDKIKEINETIKKNFNEINTKLNVYYDKNKLHNYKVLIELPSKSDEKIPDFMVDFMNLFNLSQLSNSFDGKILKLTFYRDSFIKLESLEPLLLRYNFKLKDVGMNL